MKTRLDWWKYHADFFTFPALVILTLYLNRDQLTARPFTSGLVFGWGFLFWTFCEYWIHRVVLHGFFWHGTHEIHHKRPNAHVLFPLWYVPAGFVGIWVFFFALAQAVHPAAYVAFAGFAAGYVWFTAMHHMLHHIDLTPQTWLHRYAIWHNRHHRLNDRNFGITTNLWDRVFGTSR